MSIASIAAQQQSALAAANAAAHAGLADNAATGAAGTARAALSGNFNDFLKMLMTQLRNQDPSNPLDTNQFTSQLVQFASVEQQINANANLTRLIELTQGQQVLQSAALVGKKVLVQTDRLPVQEGTARLRFELKAAQPVAVAVYSEAGVKLAEALIDGKAGMNEWVWNGRTSSGTRVADGAYRVAVIGAASNGATAAVPFQAMGTATAVQRGGETMQLRLGSATVPLSAVQAVLD
jgi:flagellar basal-body rod modification protein FlgD